MRIAAYFTSWGPVATLAQLLAAKIDTLILSFAQWDSNGNIIGSDGILAVPEYNAYYINPSYIAWTQYKFYSKNKRVSVALGGQTYDGMWDLIQTPAQRTNVVQNLKKLLDTPFPVYQKNANMSQITKCMSWTWNQKCDLGAYQPIGVVKLDALDFDFERSQRISDVSNTHVELLVKQLRKSLNRRIELSLTGFSVAADPVSCGNPGVVDKCSYTDPGGRSIHCGELLQLLGKKLFDHVNVMSYDAGPKYLYKIAMSNYARAIRGNRTKIMLGNTINSQWGPASTGGNYVESDANNKERVKWALANKYGGFFVWNIGANTEGYTIDTQIQKINSMN